VNDFMSRTLHHPVAAEMTGRRAVTVQDRLRQIQHIALDMDGTIYCGGTVFPYTNQFLKTLAELNIGFTLLTNNSSKSVEDYIAHLRRMGIRATADQLCTSTHLTIEFLREEMPEVTRIFLLGTASMGTKRRMNRMPCLSALIPA
jgi:ribonucleotide monophosphatase NagD (HAD superfamily)